jgi:hypothetical protein
MAQRCSEPGVSAGHQAEAARRYEPKVFEILEATDFDPVSGVAGENEDAVPLAGKLHRPRKRVGACQFQLEYPASVHSQRRTAVEEQSRGDVAAAGQWFPEDARLGRLAGRQVDVVSDVLLDVQIGAVFEAVLHCAMGVFFEPFP